MATSASSPNQEKKEANAFLISVYQGTNQKPVCEEHLEELALLVETYGAKVIHKEACPVRKFSASTFISEGKLEELTQMAQQLEANLVIFDDEITPAQQRNLEKAFGLLVMDRTEVILEVFAHRAQTKEARIQIELARLKYQFPRLKRLWTHLSRQAGTMGGGGAYLKGEGEKQIELDRRILKKKMEKLQKDLEDVKANRETQRVQRERTGIPVFAIIGYTNAGKSTLLNALTEANVFVEDKLFATLDTTTRKYILPSNQEILLIDTVGFIRKLPHLLVAAFKSTLEEAVQADILLHLIDVSHPAAEEQAQASYEVLKELHADQKPVITVFNKMDQLESPSKIMQLKFKYPHTVEISAKQKWGFHELVEKMQDELAKRRVQMTLRIPQKDYAIVSEMIRIGHVLKQDYEENDVILKVELPAAFASKYKKYSETRGCSQTS